MDVFLYALRMVLQNVTAARKTLAGGCWYADQIIQWDFINSPGQVPYPYRSFKPLSHHIVLD